MSHSPLHASARNDTSQHNGSDVAFNRTESSPPEHMALIENLPPLEPVTPPTEEDIVLDSWNPIPLGPLLAGPRRRLAPSLLTRIDGQALLYPKRVHTFQGESQSGKSWLAMLAAAQVLENGGRVVYVDFEDGWEEFTDRIQDLGIPHRDADARCRYIAPESWHVLAPSRLKRLLPDVDLLIMDGVTNAMGMMGLNPMEMVDVSYWTRNLRALASSGCAVVQIDHVTKSREGRGQYAIGSVHKMNAVDGAVYGLEAVKSFGKGLDGWARIRLHKDRPGALRRAAEGNVIGILQFASNTSTEAVSLKLEPPGTDKTASGNFRPTTLMGKVSTVLASTPEEGLSKNQIEGQVRGKTTAVRNALAALVEEGYVRETQVGQKKLHSLVHRFEGGLE